MLFGILLFFLFFFWVRFYWFCRGLICFVGELGVICIVGIVMDGFLELVFFIFVFIIFELVEVFGVEVILVYGL